MHWGTVKKQDRMEPCKRRETLKELTVFNSSLEVAGPYCKRLKIANCECIFFHWWWTDVRPYGSYSLPIPSKGWYFNALVWICYSLLIHAWEVCGVLTLHTACNWKRSCIFSVIIHANWNIVQHKRYNPLLKGNLSQELCISYALTS